MSNEQAAPETNGVTAELLATVDLGPEIEGMAGRRLRMRAEPWHASCSAGAGLPGVLGCEEGEQLGVGVGLGGLGAGHGAAKGGQGIVGEAAVVGGEAAYEVTGVAIAQRGDREAAPWARRRAVMAST